MEVIHSKSILNNVIQEHEMVLVYISTKSCGVCQVIKPQVKQLISNYPKIKLVEIKADQSISLSASLEVFTVPAVLLFIEGKEAIREARHISLINLEQKIARYYELFYQ